MLSWQSLIHSKYNVNVYEFLEWWFSGFVKRKEKCFCWITAAIIWCWPQRGINTACRYKARSWGRDQIGLVLLDRGSAALSGEEERENTVFLISYGFVTHFVTRQISGMTCKMKTITITLQKNTHARKSFKNFSLTERKIGVLSLYTM